MVQPSSPSAHLYAEQGSEASLLFYAKAKARIWRQSFAMYSLAMAYSGLVLVRHFTLFGRGSPQLFMTAQASTRHGSRHIIPLSYNSIHQV